MNSRIFNKVLQQSLRHSHYRYLSIQQNINKCSNTCHTVNFHRKKENHSPSFVFTKFSNDKTLCQSTLPIYTSSQRNLSSTPLLLNQAASVEPLKKAANVAAPTGDVTQNVAAPTGDVTQNVAAPTGDVTQNVAAPTGNVTQNVATPTVDVTQNVSSNWITPDVAENWLIEYVQQLLVQMHEATGLSWWSSIALTALFLRATVTLPFAITQVRVMASLEKVGISMESVEKKMKKETVKAQKEYGWPEKLANEKYEQATNKAWWGMAEKENCHPAKMYLLISVQLSLFATGSVATATLCDPNLIGPSIYNQMTTGGFGWVKDLTVIDPHLVLPLSIALMNLIIVEVHHCFRAVRTSKAEQWKCAIFRAISIAMLPLAAYLPAAVNVYWLSSSFYGFLQALLLNSSPMRRIFRVPMNDPELKRPYRFALKNFKAKLKLNRRQPVVATK